MWKHHCIFQECLRCLQAGQHPPRQRALPADAASQGQRVQPPPGNHRHRPHEERVGPVVLPVLLPLGAEGAENAFQGSANHAVLCVGELRKNKLTFPLFLLPTLHWRTRLFHCHRTKSLSPKPAATTPTAPRRPRTAGPSSRRTRRGCGGSAPGPWACPAVRHN